MAAHEKHIKDGKSAARWIAPVAAAVLAVLIGTVLLLPMMKMNPREIPVAVLSLDKGVTVSGEQINAGEALTDALIDSQGEEDSPLVAWTVMDSQEDLDAAMLEGDYYAAIVIPADFSESQAAIAGREALGSALVDKLPELSDGASSLAEGAGALHDGSTALSSGVSQLSNGADDLASHVGDLPSKAESLAAGAQGLSSSLGTLSGVAGQLGSTVKGLCSDGTEYANAIAALNAAEAVLTDESASPESKAAAIASARAALDVIAGAAETLNPSMDSLAQGLILANDIASALNEGASALAQAAPVLSQGVTALADGAAKAQSGADALASGAGTLSSGAGTYSEAISEANNTLEELPDGGVAQDSDADNNESGEEGSTTLGMSAPSGPKIELIINQGKNPMVTNSLSAALNGLAASSGLAFETTYVNELPENMGIGVTHMILMILTYLGSYATGAVIAGVLKPRRNDKRGLLVGSAVQVAYAFLCALLVGVAAATVLQVGLGGTIPFVDLALFVSLASFSFQLLVIGSVKLLGTAGMIVPIGLLVIGMGAAYLPVEFLPDFWRDYVYPWDPLRYMVDGFRSILYLGEGFVNDASGPLLLVAAIGLVLMLLSVVKDARGALLPPAEGGHVKGKEEAYV